MKLFSSICLPLNFGSLTSSLHDLELFMSSVAVVIESRIKCGKLFPYHKFYFYIKTIE